MTEYIIRLAILLPLVCAMAWGSLWLWKKSQMGLTGRHKAQKSAEMIDVIPMGTNGKLAVVAFGDRELLVAVSRSQISLLAEQHRGDFHA